ncbi:MAG: RdgB/HAM1 family non-canonical purine NTP pyrophosphatase [Candidatus Nanopelagicaceae bacterium]|jgi:XTP/dITP diphosphohydrolase
MKLVLATKNQGKVIEFRRILEELGATNLEVLGMDSFPEIGDIEETGNTFQENSLLKARTISEITGLAALADDSGICVDALDGAPGIYSARYSGNGDAANNQKLLAELREVSDEKRTAYFICVAAFVRPDGFEKLAEGRFYGKILHEVRGSGGFGYDPLFQPDGLSCSAAELSAQQKDEISHRGIALRAIAPYIIG